MIQYVCIRSHYNLTCLSQIYRYKDIELLYINKIIVAISLTLFIYKHTFTLLMLVLCVQVTRSLNKLCNPIVRDSEHPSVVNQTVGTL